MRVRFPRLPDHQRAYALVERDDGVVDRRDGGMAGPRLPHDIMHLVVERELRIGDGIWGGIAAGVDSASLRAELLADLVSSAAALDRMTPADDQAAGGRQAFRPARGGGGSGRDRRGRAGAAGGGGPLGPAADRLRSCVMSGRNKRPDQVGVVWRLVR